MRTFEASDLVVLPRLDANGAAALGAEMLTAAAAVKKLPPAIAPRKKALAGAVDALHAALRDRFSAPAVDSARARAADVAEDASWSALHDWLSGWSKLPASVPAAASASELLAILFPDGLKFTRLAFKAEWSEVEARLQRIDKDGLDKPMVALGGQPFLDNLRAAHKEYGEALGITQHKAAPVADATAVKDALAAVMAALRGYVLQVAAHVNEEDPATSDLASQLLQPLARWQPATGSARPAAPPTPAAGGSAPAA